MGLIQRVKTSIRERRQRILDGKINCIPSPFKTFKYDFPGIEQGVYYLISGSGKSSKSRLTNFLFVFNAVLYAYEHPNLLRLKIFYVLLEETAENITMKFICYLLYVKSKIRVDIKTLKSVDAYRIIDEKTLGLLDTLEYSSILSFFEDHVDFIPDRNPTGIYNTLQRYAKSHGTIVTKKIPDFDDNAFDYYVPDDPDEYVMCVVDHVSLLNTEQGFDLRNTIKKLSNDMKRVRNRYNYIPVIVQQQNKDTISLDAYKEKKITPTQAGCADSTDPPKDCDVMLGITSPFAFEISNYFGYDISKLRGYARFMTVVLGRDGESNSVLPLFFDGAVGYYTPLPKASNQLELEKVYKLVEQYRNDG